MIRWWMKSLQVGVLGAMLLVPSGELLAKPGNKKGKSKGSEKHEMKQEQKEQQKAQKRNKDAFYEYDHYLNQNVYYNRTTDTYYWIDSGKWHQGRRIPGNYTLGGTCDRIRIGNETPFDYHRMNYERLPYEHGRKNFGKRRGPPDHAPAWGYRKKFGYIYYPDHDIYYYPQEKQYAWIESGKMKIGYELPDWIRVDPCGGVNIDLERAVNLNDFKKIFR